MKWAAVAVVAAALLAGGCNGVFIQGTVIEKAPNAHECVQTSGRTTLMKIQSDVKHVDPNDPDYKWAPLIRDTCVTPKVADQYPIGSHYAA
jgi:hypothetical protein